MPDITPSLVEAAARAMREWGVPGTDGGLTILAEEVLAAVGDALRLEGAQAERERILAIVEAQREHAGLVDMLPERMWGAAWMLDAVLAALGGVHPEASDG